MIVHCTVERTSRHEPPCEGAVLRRFTIVYAIDNAQRVDRWCLTFESTDAFFEWLSEASFAVVLCTRTFPLVARDGDAVPEWEVEIYDDRRE